MGCNCGSVCEIRSVQKDLKKVAEYWHCPACGRICWIWKS